VEKLSKRRYNLPNLLQKLQLTELSLVDRPANAQAMVSLFKRDTSQEELTKMTDEMEAKVKAYMDKKGVGREEAMKAMDMYKADEAPEVNPLEAEVVALKADNEMLRKGLIDNGYVISAEAIEKKSEEEMMDIEGEMVVKSDIPAPVLKALQAAIADKATHALEKADIELTKRAGDTLPHFDVDVAKSLVDKFYDDEKIMEALKAADAAFDASMQEFGKSDVDGDFTSPTDKLDALVKSYMDDNQLKKSDFAKAYAAVAKTDEGKSLINKSYKGE
jgi:hypothetical protein